MPDSIHFRCTFDVHAREGGGFPELVQEIIGWIRSKEGSALDLRAGRLLTSGTTRRGDGRAAVTVDSLSESELPDLWALRYEHQDAEFSPRRWSIDFGITRTDSRTWRLAVTIGNSLHQAYIGKEPGLLPVTPPRVIKTLVSSDKFKCCAGSTELRVDPFVVHVGKADRLAKAIEDPARSCPLVYVSRSRLTGEPLIDPIRLASTIVGAGVVFLAADAEIDEELEFLVPREFRSPNGMVRVYAPRVRFDIPQQAYRHRFFTRTQVEELTATEVEGQIARALARRYGWASIRSSLASFAVKK